MADTWKEYSCSSGCGKNRENSISHMPGHLRSRHRCVETVHEHFGYLPFVPSHYYAAELKANPAEPEADEVIVEERGNAEAQATAPESRDHQTSAEKKPN